MENDNKAIIALILIAIAFFVICMGLTQGIEYWTSAAIGMSMTRNLRSRKVLKPIELFAARKGFYVVETNKVYRLYPVRPLDSTPVAATLIKMNELAIADFLMLEADLPEYRERTLKPVEERGVSLEGMSPKERDAKILEMTNGK